MEMTFPFKVIQHQIPGQHIRLYPRGTKHSQETVLRIAIKQYVPIDLPEIVPDHAVTIIATHGNGFVKVRLISTKDFRC